MNDELLFNYILFQDIIVPEPATRDFLLYHILSSFLIYKFPHLSSFTDPSFYFKNSRIRRLSDQIHTGINESNVKYRIIEGAGRYIDSLLSDSVVFLFSSHNWIFGGD